MEIGIGIFTKICWYTIELGYNVMEGAEYFVSL